MTFNKVVTWISILAAALLFGCSESKPLDLEHEHDHENVGGLVLCRRVWAVFVAAVVTALAAGFLGLWASFDWDLPTGPAIVCAEGSLFLLAVVVRGLR